MSPSKYRINSEVSGRPRAIELIIYDDLRTFRAAAARHSGTPGEFKDALGSTTGILSVHVNPDGSVDKDSTEGHFVAIVRLVRGYLTPEIVAHEVAHLCQWLYYCDGLEPIENDLAVGPYIDAPTDPSAHFTNHNERFAYMTGALFGVIWEIVNLPE